MFTEDARVEFRGIELGPFIGKPAIARAFADRPPTDELELVGVSDTGTAVYGWKKRPGKRAGTLHMELEGMSIARLLISVD